ncbi:MAG: GntR family transcriptional regulator [Arthrobacter sp.]|uniref:GntR family transcriptional regulator n=1 Tax=Arthrobacter sp. TaxID=1667 RepID=UPI0034979435
MTDNQSTARPGPGAGGGARETKYGRIATVLRQRCARLGDGQQLPSEKELATEFGVSLMTLRRALDLLDEEGIVRRVLGRGTFVQRRIVAKGDVLTSFSEDMRMRGLTPSSRLIGIEVLEPAEDVRKDLLLGPRESVVALERLRLADGEAMCLETAHLAARFTGVLEADALEGSLHELLASRGHVLESAVRRIRAVAADERQALLLGLRAGEPVLQIIQVFYDAKGTAIQRSCAHYRADRYEAFTKVRRAPAG